MIEQAVSLQATYDADADAVYIYFSAPGAETPISVHAVPVDPGLVKGMVNLDVDEEGQLAGIEIIDASKKLSPSLLEQLASNESDPAGG